MASMPTAFLKLSLVFFLLVAWTPITGKVNFVYDGDTILVGSTKVRLLGVNSPEVAWPKYQKKGECFGAEAKAWFSSRLLGKKVTLLPDPLAPDRDRYGRLLATVKFRGKNVNEELIKKGCALAPTRFPHSRMKEFVALEREAKKSKRGLWGECRVWCRGDFCKTAYLR